MLTGIRLRNFKCFEELNLEKLGRINVFIGPNGSGKSSVLQALMALRQSLGGDGLKLRGEYVDLVGFKETVFEGDTSRRLGIGITARATGGPTTATFEYDADFRPHGKEDGRLSRNAISIDWEGAPIAVVWQSDAENVASSDVHIGSLVASVHGNQKVAHPLVVEPHGGIPPGNDWAHDVIHLLGSMSRDEVGSWRFSTIIRGFIGSTFPLGDNRLLDLLPRMGLEEAATGIATTLIYASDEVADLVSGWMKCVTDVDLVARPEEGKQAVLRSVRNGLRIPITSEGFGTNQIAFLLFAIALARPGSLVAIEEPETHLHPLAISKLGDLLVRIAHEHDLQLILTTHSEYLLLNLLNNVAEGKLAVDDLGIYYFEREDDRCTARRLGITERGMVEGGLPGFFDAALEAQRRQMDALVHTP